MRDKTEEKVVQMRFDNKQYEKNANKTLKTNEKLDKSMQFKGSRKELKELSKALKEIDTREANRNIDETNKAFSRLSMTVKDIVKFKIVSNFVDKLSDVIGKTVKQIAGINTIVEGWSKYETQITNIGGILNSVEKNYADHATALEAVTNEMEKLQWYTDETSFSFSTLSTGIKQFTTAGIGLEKATQAAMGVTSLAGASKVFEPYKVQSAMDAVAKSMQSGYMNLLQWTSLTNTAGIVTEEFSQALLDAGVAQGKLVKSQAGQYKTKKGGKLVTTENIRDTLSDKWLTSDVLSSALSLYSSAVEQVRQFQEEILWGSEEITDDVQNMMDKLGITDADNITLSETIKLMENLGYEFDAIGKKALISSYQATSFSQVLTATKDAVATQWQSMFENIFGNADEATELWTDMSNLLYRSFVPALSSANEMMARWHDLDEGGYQDFRQVLINLITIINNFKDAVSEAFVEVFGDIDENVIAKIVKAIKDWTESLKNNEAAQETVKNIAKALFTIIKLIGKTLGKVIALIAKLGKILKPVINLLHDIVDQFLDWVLVSVDWIEKTGIIEGILRTITDAVKMVYGWIKDLVNLVVNSDIFKKLSDGIKSTFDSFKNKNYSKGITTFFDTIKATFISWYNTISAKLRDKKLDIMNSVFVQSLIKLWTAIRTGAASILSDLNKQLDKFIELAKNGEITWSKNIKPFLENLVTMLIMLQGIKMFLSVGRILSGFSEFIRQLGGLTKAIKNSFKARTYKALGLMALEFSAAVLILAFACAKIGEVDWKKQLANIGMITLLIAAIAGAVALAARLSGGGSDVKGIISLVSAALAFSILIKVAVKMLTKAKEMETKDILKLGLLFAELAVVFGIVIMSSRIGNKGTPFLISYIKTIGALFLVVVALNLLMKYVSKQNPYVVLASIIGLATIFVGLSGLILAMGLSAKIAKENMKNITALLLAISSIIVAIALVIDTVNRVNNVDWPSVGKALLVVAGSFAAVTILLITMGVLGKKNAVIAGPAISNFLLPVIAIAGAIFLFIETMKYVSNPDNIQISKEAYSVVASLLVIVGGIAILLSKFGRTLTKDKSFERVKGADGKLLTSSKKEKNVGVVGALVGIVLSVAAIVFLLQYVSKLDLEALKPAYKVVGIIGGTIAAIVMGLLYISKYANDKALREIRNTMIVLSIMLAEIMAIVLIVKYTGVSWKDLAKTGAILGGLLLFIAILAVVMKKAQEEIGKKTGGAFMKTLLKFFIIAAVLIAEMIGLVLAVKMSGADAGTIGAVVAIMGTLLVFISALIGIIVLARKEMNTRKDFELIDSLRNLFIVMAALILVVGAVTIALVSTGVTFQNAIGPLGAMMIFIAVMALVTIALSQFVAKSDTKTIAATLITMAAIIAEILVFSKVLETLANLDQGKLASAAKTLEWFAGIISGILGALAVIALLLGSGDAKGGAEVLVIVAGALDLLALAVMGMAEAILIVSNGLTGLMTALDHLTKDKVGLLGLMLTELLAYEQLSGVMGVFALLGNKIVGALTKLIDIVVQLTETSVGNFKTLLESIARFNITKSQVASSENAYDVCKNIKDATKQLMKTKIDPEKLAGLETVANTLKTFSELNLKTFFVDDFITRLKELMDQEFSFSPVVTPVVDLTQFNDGVSKIKSDLANALSGSIQVSYRSAGESGNIDNSVNNSNNVLTVNMNGETITQNDATWSDAFSFSAWFNKIKNFIF